MTIILRTAARQLLPLLVLFSVFLLLRGHNAPGGGFVGGLVAAAAFTLYALAFGPAAARAALRAEPRSLVVAGLLVAGAAGAAGPLYGRPFLTGLWAELTLPLFGTLYLGTPLLFDLGVYLVVLGVTLTILLTLAEG